MSTRKTLGFWSCWALMVGIMIGTGIFILPTLLAPYGLLSLAGWTMTATGSLLLALIIARLSSRTERSGGVYVFAHDAFGELPGFLMGWSFWASYWISIPVVAIGFVAYLGVFFPSLETSPVAQAGVALALIWILTLINMKSLKGASVSQLIMTLLKIVPLLLVLILGIVSGDSANFPRESPTDISVIKGVATAALLTMWAFVGLEAGSIPASDVREPRRTIARATIFSVLTVAVIYIGSTIAVMRLVPTEILLESTSPYADAAKQLGAWGPYLVGVGVLISAAGALNGIIFVAGQMPMALAIDGLAPRVFATRGERGAPYISLLLGSGLGSILLLTNYTKGLVGAYTFLAMMGTLTALVPLLVSVAADAKYSWRSEKTWLAVALFAALYSIFAILGSGIEVLAWGSLLFLLGVPVYFLIKRAT